MTDLAQYTTATLALQVLLSGPVAPRGLMWFVRSRSGGKIEIGQAASYAALRWLEGRGLAESYLESPAPGMLGRRPRWYRLTPVGRDRAEADRALTARLFGLPRPRST